MFNCNYCVNVIYIKGGDRMSKRKSIGTNEKKSRQPSLNEIAEAVSGRTIRMDEQDLRVFNCIGDAFHISLKDVMKKVVGICFQNEEFVEEFKKSGKFSDSLIEKILEDVDGNLKNKGIEELSKKLKAESEYENYIEESFDYLMRKIEKRLKKEDTVLDATTLLYLYPEKVKKVFKRFYTEVVKFGNVRLSTLDIEFLTALAWLIDENLMLTTLPYKEHPEIVNKLQEELEKQKEVYFYFDQFVICQYEYYELEELLDKYDIKPIVEFLRDHKSDLLEDETIDVQFLVNCFRDTVAYSKKLLGNKL